MESFGELIRRHRKFKGFTLTQLAALLDMDSANLSKIETGKRDFDERKLIKLAKIFNLNFEDLQTEYFSDKIAKKLYENSVPEKTLLLAEQKVKYYRQKNVQQKELGF
jgi:HTH-type transcriptional regulator, competence development regulator